MGEYVNAIRGVIALGFGGLLFIMFGGALASSSTLDPAINLQLWGLIYIVGAILLAVGIVYAGVRSILS